MNIVLSLRVALALVYLEKCLSIFKIHHTIFHKLYSIFPKSNQHMYIQRFVRNAIEKASIDNKMEINLSKFPRSHKKSLLSSRRLGYEL